MNFKTVPPIISLFGLLCTLGCVQPNNNEQSEVLTVANADFFHIVSYFIEKGRTIIIPSKGTSMLPLIQDGDAIILEPIKPGEVQRFDVILYEPEPESFYLNRVAKISGQMVTMAGDAVLNNSKGSEYNKDIVRARAVGFITDNNKAYSLDDQAARDWASGWYEQQDNEKDILETTIRQQVLNHHSERILTKNGLYSAAQYDSLQKYRGKTNIIKFSVDDTDVLIKDENPVDLRKIISLNETALYLWESVTGKIFDAATLAKLLTDVYEVSYTMAYDDSVILIKEWLSYGIIEPDLE